MTYTVFDAPVPGAEVAIECRLCGWHALAPRQKATEAWSEHHRIQHAQQTATAVIGGPARREAIVLPGFRKEEK